MTDRISIKGLVVETRIGVTEEERSQPQPLVIDLELAADLTAAAKSDDLAYTVDYDELTRNVAIFVRQSECRLLERLAAEICDVVSAFPGVLGVTVSVMKQHVPVDEEVSGISVRIARGDF